MTVYMSEEEQIQIIKSWWKKYGNMLVIAISMLLLSVAAYRYWFWHKNSVAQQASGIYERMMVAYSNEDFKQVRSNSRRLIDDYKHTIYADVAYLTLAKIAVNSSKYKLAKNSLSQVISESKSQLMIDIARIRLARLLILDKSYQAALDSVSRVKNKSMLAMVNEIKGDIAFAEKDQNNASKYYNAALLEAEKNGAASLFLDMKSKHVLISNDAKIV